MRHAFTYNLALSVACRNFDITAVGWTAPRSTHNSARCATAMKTAVQARVGFWIASPSEALAGEMGFIASL
jgi:hypothetical protein